jgi:hypothetical protein
LWRGVFFDATAIPEVKIFEEWLATQTAWHDHHILLFQKGLLVHTTTGGSFVRIPLFLACCVERALYFFLLTFCDEQY